MKDSQTKGIPTYVLGQHTFSLGGYHHPLPLVVVVMMLS
jgi:hypothetical protein